MRDGQRVAAVNASSADGVRLRTEFEQRHELGAEIE
jgi:hypothetical protein